MFGFLSDRYPLIMQRLDEDHVFDNFYLDMNGIIHQCTHPDDEEIAILDIDEMFKRIFNYTERLYRIVAPRKVMFLAVDGVAPRAKMNQQRSRRFRSAKEAERIMSEAIARGDEIPDGARFDSNCITPGTQFMHALSRRFREWIHEKMSSDPAWQQGCTVVFSGSEVPGEGEHKIMDYIRKWKKSGESSDEVRHCMYGLDADLMMLGLVSHSPHFTLIREKIRYSKNGRRVPEMTGTASDAEEFELLEIAMLRDMLFLEVKRGDSDDPVMPGGRPLSRKSSRLERLAELAVASSDGSRSSSQGSGEKPRSGDFKYQMRRIVDDFVFMCMLVGNDFIPNLPHLDIAEGAINLMFRIYRRMLPKWGGYLTRGHCVHTGRLESFLSKIAHGESAYFEHRSFSDGIQEYKSPRYRRRYYMEKFGFDVEAPDGEARLRHLRKIYLEGLHWVLQYYHNGVSSWNWFYPDFYAVLASDFRKLGKLQIVFQKGKPFRPLTQLMAVLPPESADLLPEPMSNLMVDPASPVAHFYPTEFETDQNGKRNPWEAVVVVPFIDESNLLAEVNKIDRTALSEDEKNRDMEGPEYWFYAKDYPRSSERMIPVRPSKYFIPDHRRSRSNSPRGRNDGFRPGARSTRRPPRPTDRPTSYRNEMRDDGATRRTSRGESNFSERSPRGTFSGRGGGTRTGDGSFSDGPRSRGRGSRGRARGRGRGSSRGRGRGRGGGAWDLNPRGTTFGGSDVPPMQ